MAIAFGLLMGAAFGGALMLWGGSFRTLVVLALAGAVIGLFETINRRPARRGRPLKEADQEGPATAPTTVYLGRIRRARGRLAPRGPLSGPGVVSRCASVRDALTAGSSGPQGAAGVEHRDYRRRWRRGDDDGPAGG